MEECEINIHSPSTLIQNFSLCREEYKVLLNFLYTIMYCVFLALIFFKNSKYFIVYVNLNVEISALCPQNRQNSYCKINYVCDSGEGEYELYIL